MSSLLYEIEKKNISRFAQKECMLHVMYKTLGLSIVLIFDYQILFEIKINIFTHTSRRLVGAYSSLHANDLEIIICVFI